MAFFTNFLTRRRNWLLVTAAVAVVFMLLVINSCAAEYESGGTAEFPATGVGGNFVQNGGFENRSSTESALPQSWIRDLSATAGKGSAVRTETLSRTGNASLLLTPTRRNDEVLPLGVAQEIPTAALRGKEIQFSADLRTEGEAAAAVGVMSVANGQSSPFTVLYQGPESDWRRQSSTFQVPDAADTRLYLSVWTVGQSGSAAFDNLSISVAESDDRVSASDSPVAPSNPRSAARGPAIDAVIDVNTAETGRRIPETLFGTNIEWRWDATSLWDVQINRVDPVAEQLTDDLGVTLIRYPGGIYSDYYRWREGTGPHSERPLQTHEPGKDDASVAHFGTDEVLDFADRVGAEVMITVNMVTGTVEEAAEWVRYVNRDELRVRFWEIGNEQYINNGTPVAERSTMTPQEYADRAVEFADAMKAADPRIRIGLIGGLNEGNYRQMDYDQWNEIVYRRAGQSIDFVSIHNAYAPVLTGDEQGMAMRDVYRAMMSRPLSIANNLDRMQRELELNYPDSEQRPFIAVTEWGPIFQFFNSGEYVDHAKTLGSAVFSASTLKALLEAENTDLAAFWMLNDFGVLGWIGSRSSNYPPDPDWAPTPRYFAFQLFSEYFGEQLVQTTVDGPAFDAPKVGWSGPMEDVPYIEAISSLGDDGRLHVIVINKHFDSPVNAALRIDGFIPAPTVTQHQLSGTALDAHTGTQVIQTPFFEWGEQVTDARFSRFAESNSADVTLITTDIEQPPGNLYSFPPHSVTSLVFSPIEP